MKTIINDNQRGLLFKNGKFVKLLTSGKHTFFGNRSVEICDLSKGLTSKTTTLDVLLSDPEIKSQTVVAEVGDCQLALHFVNGKISEALSRGRYVFWTVSDKHEFQMVDLSSPVVSDDIPGYIFKILSPLLYVKIEVAEYQKARLYFNGKLEKLLDAGVYYFWRTDVRVEADLVDTRLTRLDIVGQEMLTQDKVSVRVNFVCNYRITDYVKVVTDIDDYKEQIHVAAQLALRDFVGRYHIDDILENKDQMSEYVYKRLKEKEKELYVDITDAGVKDIILPGEVRDIMNTVLIAQKRAQANVITRREEVASTRSLLNTAKLMDENRTLYKLKELEYVERICANVGNINVNGNNDIISGLTALLGGVRSAAE